MVSADLGLDGGQLRVSLEAPDERGEPIRRYLHIAIEKSEIGHIRRHAPSKKRW
jgi:hypothetical protein